MPANLWISPELLAAFDAGQTTAHRLFTSNDAWAERLGEDVLISFKTDAARDSTLAGLRDWERRSGFRTARVFGRFLPKQNAERIAPTLIEGDAGLPLSTGRCANCEHRSFQEIARPWPAEFRTQRALDGRAPVFGR